MTERASFSVRNAERMRVCGPSLRVCESKCHSGRTHGTPRVARGRAHACVPWRPTRHTRFSVWLLKITAWPLLFTVHATDGTRLTMYHLLCVHAICCVPSFVYPPKTWADNPRRKLRRRKAEGHSPQGSKRVRRTHSSLDAQEQPQHHLSSPWRPSRPCCFVESTP